MDIKRRAVVEGIGTFWLVLGGCGSAVISTASPGSIGMLGVALAFGLTVLTMAYAIGDISGCHLNPAVTVGLWVGGRFPVRDIPAYVIAQVLGSIAAALVLLFIASGSPEFNLAKDGLAENGYGELSPGGYSLAACFLTEAVLTAAFLFIILCVTTKRAAAMVGPVAIGMTLTLIHLISIPVTNTSVNPARSTGPALMVGGTAVEQLWLFWLAPLLGAVAGGLLYRSLFVETARSTGDSIITGEAPVPSA